MKSSPLIFLWGLIEKLNTFLENRDQKQRNMIVGALFALVLAADFLILVQPVIHVFAKTVPELAAEKEKLTALRDDLKNKDNIEKQWTTAQAKLAEAEKQFIPQGETSSLLEKLSKLAQSSQVKIITLKPLETSDAGSGLLKIPIHISAVAATHDLGHFLSLLEGGPSYFRVADLKIVTNASDEHRHTIDLSIETYAKTK